LESFGCARGGSKNRVGVRDLVGQLEKAGAWVGRRKLEVVGYLLGQAVRPQAIVINVGEQMVNFGGKT
jgi:hypothetical protein